MAATTSSSAPVLSARRHHLLAECLRRQQAKADAARQAMEEAQLSANEHSSAMEDKFESFRENCQIQRDMFARQYDEALTGLAVLRRIQPDHLLEEVGLGALVRTEQGGHYFVGVSLGPVPDAAGQVWVVVSLQSPIGKAMMGKRLGDTFAFNGQQHQIAEIG